ncbi:hypothetical protein P171DRAFT_427186 [Karstenula rhodostoma CBS 690.94]|uniref:Uncharacterized protein n=1 Tax=Karstenula rhodostoma CBS 690.94 TaxID=1392251 RepID=A0A9P4UIR4_9PLEO|nr:hypothetical protein P171DRAFT_427186 [Karstenula rhodostoma CBS 690.94]
MADPIAVNINAGKVQGLDFNLFGTSRSVRSWAIRKFRYHNQVVLSMTTDATVTTFDDFQELRRWELSAYSGSFPLKIFLGDHRLKFLFEFQVPKGTILHDLRINITNFLKLTHCFSGKSEVRLQICTLHADTEDKGFAVIKLQELRRRCLPTLTMIILEQSEWMKRECPELWIDGEGTFISATYPAQAGRPQQTLSNADQVFSANLISRLNCLINRNRDTVPSGPLYYEPYPILYLSNYSTFLEFCYFLLTSG